MRRAVLVFLAFASLGPWPVEARAQPPTAVKISRCYCALEAPEQAGCEFKSPNAKPLAYDKWRRQVEILGFEGKSLPEATFTRTIRNVTDDDDVYLHVVIANPLRHSLSLKVTAEDTPDRPLLNFSGTTAPSLSGLIDGVQKAEKKSDTEAKGVKAEGNEQTAKAAAKLDEANERLSMTMRVQGKSPEERVKIQGQLDAATREVERLKTALETVNKEAKILDEIASLLGEIASSCASLRGRLLEAIVVGDEAGATRAIGAVAGSLPGLIDKLNEADRRLSTVDEQRRQGPKKSLDDVRAALKDLEASVASASSAMAEGDMCLYLGRFEAGKTVHVAAKLEERPGLSPLAGDPQKDLRDAIEKATKILNGAIKGEAAEAGGKKSGEASGGDKSADKATEVDPRTYSFEVMKPIHLSTGFGFPVTWLASTEYSLVAVPAGTQDGNGKTPPEQVKLVAKADTVRVLPTFFVSVNVPPQYPSSTADPDPYEGSVRTFLRRHGFTLHFGFPLSDIGKNYMFGVGFYVYPGAQLTGGVHFGKVTSLQEGFSENVPFDKPSAAFEAKDATYEHFDHSYYVGLTIDSTAISKILGGGK
jgi:hypothetical protein